MELIAVLFIGFFGAIENGVLPEHGSQVTEVSK